MSLLQFFKKDPDKRPEDVKGIRNALLQFIKVELQKAEGGEGKYIKGLSLLVGTDREDRHLYEAAVFLEEEGRFQQEVQKIADDFAIELPESWSMEVSFVDTFPPEAIKNALLNTGLLIRTREALTSVRPSISEKARITVLNGEAEKEVYDIQSTSSRFNIGRETKVLAADGFVRANFIAFPGDSSNDANKYISRQHAHIEWNKESSAFMLFADEGGIPPANKIKIRSAREAENLTKLNSTQIGYKLKDNDQIILGDSAVLLFNYIAASQV